MKVYHHNFASVNNLKTSNHKNIETMMLEIQILTASDFNDQIKNIGKQIKFLNKIKKSYHEQIGAIKNFMTQNPNTSRNDGKVYYEASFEQMANLTKNFKTHQYNLQDLTSKEVSITYNDTGSNHQLDNGKNKSSKAYITINNGEASWGQLHDYFVEGSLITENEKARNFARKLPDDNSQLPIYYGHANNNFDDGKPKFSMLSEQLDRIVDQLQNKLSDLETDTEELSTKLNNLSRQRKTALDNANLVLKKIADIKNKTLNT